MTTVLQITTSLFSGDGESSRLANRLVSSLRDKQPDINVVSRDLAADPVPHLNGERFGAFITKPAQRTPVQQAILNYSDALIDELRRADIIVLGLPMYNFGLPSQLKAYFDHVARAGETFRYTAEGSVGLLDDKKVYVLATRGGFYGDSHSHSEYIRQIFGFFGLNDVEFVYAEGLAISDEHKRDGIAQAQNGIARLALPEALAA